MFHRFIPMVICLASIFAGFQAHAGESKSPRSAPVSAWKKVDVLRGVERATIGFSDPFPSAAVQHRFPYRVLLVVEYDKEGSLRLPNAEEQIRFDAYELALRKEFARDGLGVVVVSIASDGLFQLICYAADGTKGEARLVTALPKQNEGANEESELQHSSERDAEWTYVAGLQRLFTRQLRFASCGIFDSGVIEV
jgi:hypothetical protein